MKVDGMYLSIIKAVYDKPIANNTKLEKLKLLLLKSGMLQGCPHSPFLLSIVLEFLASVVTQTKKQNGCKLKRRKSNHPYLQII
jgi:hypothetical protein